MIHVDLPWDYGTFMKVKSDLKDISYCGTVVAYTVTDNGWLIWVSGYKIPITGEYMPEEVEPMTEQEIEELKKEFGK